MANIYDVGAKVRCSATFTDSAGDPADPTAVVFTFKDPSANETEYNYGVDAELVKDDTGDYHVDVVIDDSGRWWFRYEGTGAVVAAGESYFNVRASQF